MIYSKVTFITDGNQYLYFKNRSECAKFLSKKTDYKPGTIRGLLSQKVKFIGKWKIIY